jgi:hypothetical protein
VEDKRRTGREGKQEAGRREKGEERREKREERREKREERREKQ